MRAEGETEGKLRFGPVLLLAPAVSLFYIVVDIIALDSICFCVTENDDARRRVALISKFENTHKKKSRSEQEPKVEFISQLKGANRFN